MTHEMPTIQCIPSIDSKEKVSSARSEAQVSTMTRSFSCHAVPFFGDVLGLTDLDDVEPLFMKQQAPPTTSAAIRAEKMPEITPVATLVFTTSASMFTSTSTLKQELNLMIRFRLLSESPGRSDR